MAIREDKLNEFMGNFVHDIGAVMHAATVVVGDQLGLYKSLAVGPATADELAARAEVDSRYLREWLCAQAGEARTRDVATQGGFTQFRRATQTPFNLVYEARSSA